MNDDDRLLLEVRSWLKDEHVVLPDAEQAGHLVAAALPKTRQLRRKWWPLPIPGRVPAPPTSRQATEFQPSPIQATNGQTPTVFGRTQTMFSPATAITASALVLAIGGGMLIAQPFGSQPGVAPGAEADVPEPVPFTVTFIPAGSVRRGSIETEAGVSRSTGNCWAPTVANASDPRVDGTLTYCADEHSYRRVGPDVRAWTITYRLTNDDGAWQGSHVGVEWEDPESGDLMVSEGGLVLVGDGAYDGLYAALTLHDWNDIRGVIVAGAPPVAPVPPPAD